MPMPMLMHKAAPPATGRAVDIVALAVVDDALKLRASHPAAPTLDILELVLQGKSTGATLEKMEVVLKPAFHEAMKSSSRSWPVISEDVQERCLTSISGRMHFIEGLSPQQQAQATSDAIGDHPEQPLLAYVFGKLKDNYLLGIKSESEKMLMLAALNLVECIAGTAPQRTKRYR